MNLPHYSKLKHHCKATTHHQKRAIEKLQESLLKRLASPPRVNLDNPVPVPRVYREEPTGHQSNVGGPPDLMEEYNIMMAPSIDTKDPANQKHTHDLREHKELLNKIITSTTKPSLVSEQATKSINVPSTTNDMAVDGHRLPIIDNHLANTLKRCQKIQQKQFNEPIDHNKTDVRKRQPKVESDNAVFEPTSGTCLEYRQIFKTKEKDVWTNSFGTLAQGHQMTGIKCTSAIKFTPWNELPKNKK